MNNVTLVDVRNEAMDTIQKLKNKEIDIATAKEIRSCLDTIVSTAKSQVDFINAIPKHIKDKMDIEDVLCLAGSYRDDNAELDKTLNFIEKKNKETYLLSK